MPTVVSKESQPFCNLAKDIKIVNLTIKKVPSDSCVKDAIVVLEELRKKIESSCA